MCTCKTPTQGMAHCRLAVPGAPSRHCVVLPAAPHRTAPHNTAQRGTAQQVTAHLHSQGRKLLKHPQLHLSRRCPGAALGRPRQLARSRRQRQDCRTSRKGSREESGQSWQGMAGAWRPGASGVRRKGCCGGGYLRWQKHLQQWELKSLALLSQRAPRHVRA